MLFLPASIQIAHAFEPHEHIICSSDVEHHFHEDDIECALCHLQAENHWVVTKNNYNVIPTPFYIHFNEDIPVIFSEVYLYKKSSRAPPYFTVH